MSINTCVVFCLFLRRLTKETVSHFIDASPPKDAGEGPSRPRGPVSMLIGDIGLLVSELETSYAAEAGSMAQKDAEISRLQAQLEGARSEADSWRSHAEKLSDEKVALLLQAKGDRAQVERYQADMKWLGEFLQEWNEHHFGQVEELRQAMEIALRTHEEKLRRMSIEYDEELYPHLMQMIAERRYNNSLYISYFLYCLLQN